jgi:hypothetical protein
MTTLSEDSCRDEVISALSDIRDAADTDAFRSLIRELNSLGPSERYAFVEDVMLRPDSLTERGVILPQGIARQRSYFRDGRPTLFCLTKHLSVGHPWSKVTLTWDNPDGFRSLQEVHGGATPP